MNKLTQRKKVAVSLSITFLLETLLLIVLVSKFSSPVTDVVGAPLLKENMGYSVVFKLFAGFNLVFLPILFAFLPLRIRQSNSESFSIIQLSFYLLQIIVFTILFFHRYANDQYLALVFFLVGIPIFIFTNYLLQAALKSLKLDGNARDKIYIFLTFPFFVQYLKSVFYANQPKIVFINSAFVFFLLATTSFIPKKLISRHIGTVGINHLVWLYIWTVVLTAKPVGALNLNPYESFPYANNLQLSLGGRPWRDFSLEHGLWEDLGRNFIGSYIGGPGLWQQTSIIQGLLVPIEIFILVLTIYAISKNFFLAFAILVFFTYINNNFFQILFPRAIPLILATYVLRKLLICKSKYSAPLLGASLAFSLIWSQESLFFIISVAILLTWILFKSKDLISKQNYLSVFFTFFLLFVGPLLAAGLLDDWTLSFISNSSGYLLAWGAPIVWSNGPVFALTFILVPLYIARVLFKVVRELKTVSENQNYVFVWIAPLIFETASYFIKFLAWPDWHLAQSGALAFYGLAILIGSTTAKNPNLLKINLMSIPILVILSIGLVTSFQQIPVLSKSDNYVGNLDEYTKGYVDRITDVNSDFLKYLPNRPQLRIFDFGNEPLTWYGILKYRTVGDQKIANYHGHKSEASLVRRLKRNPPDAVIWGSEYGYFNWPYPGNQLKYPIISEYLYANFKPVAVNGKYILMLPNSSRLPVSKQAIDAMTQYDCDWSEVHNRYIPPHKIPSNPSTGIIVKTKNTKLVLHRNYLTANSIVKEKITLKSNYVTGKIQFESAGANLEQNIWLSGCAAWHFSELGSWKISN